MSPIHSQYVNNSILPPDLHVKAVSGAIKSVSAEKSFFSPDEKGKENWGKQKWKDTYYTRCPKSTISKKCQQDATNATKATQIQQQQHIQCVQCLLTIYKN